MRLGRSAVIALVGLAVLSAAGTGIADAQSSREVRRASPSRPPGKPLLAVIALNEQRITVYDALGPISQAPVSTGSAGYETPAGIFSIVQKNEFHQSNLYEDGDMPFMQRITWTGIALHAGALPGYPASHGCIRLPMSYAENLFGSTELGMRVVIVRDDMLPVEISHPALFRSRPVPKALASVAAQVRRLGQKGGSAAERIAYAATDADIVPGSPQHVALLKSVAAAKAAEREAALAREREAKQALARTTAEAAAAAKQLRAAESALGRAETALKEAERRLEKASPESAQQAAQAARLKALASLSEAEARLEAARLEAQAKSEAVEAARLEAHTATEARLDAAEAAAEAERNTAPVSVFISRTTQRLYIRKANYPIYEGPVTIRDADRPIGTFVFTALAADGAAGDMRWNVVAMYPNPTDIEPPSPKSSPSRARKADPTPTDVAAAAAALDRIEISRAALERITEVVLPGSSLIISDEAASIETGKDTDFIVVMSGEPQGALKVRKPEARPQYDDEYYWGRSPYGAYSPWFSSRPNRPRPMSRYPWW
ncbi:MAG TPA: L,D-transpeptidase family protein [Hyphomicrobiaceae bacterium]|nr:L,D-transpeptidase family protein [Hyphomicrobiaceae bacterium]